MSRPIDTVKIEQVDGAGAAVLDNFTSLELINDITSFSESSFELGNDGTFDEIADKVLPGAEYKVFLNDQMRMTGKSEMVDIPCDAGAGSVTRFVIRSKLADAQYASADPSVSVKKTSVKDFVVALYSPLGYTEDDFVFEANVARDLLTGRSTSGQGTPQLVDLEPLKTDAAKVQSSETIYNAADRHLRRFGYMHWDSPDGKIVISAPNDTQDPHYWFRLMRGSRGVENNILAATRTQDYTGIPSEIFMSGKTTGKPRRRIHSTLVDNEVTAAGFYRPVVLNDEGLRLQSLLDRATAREMSNRSMRKDAYNISLDGLSWWDGYVNVPIAVDAVANMGSDVAGVPGGAYYIYRIQLRRDATSGDTSTLTALARGIWKL